MDKSSRVFSHRDPHLRGRASNQATILVDRSGEGAAHHTAFDAKRLFVERYPVIRAALERTRRLGLLVLVFDDKKEPLARAFLEASLDTTRKAVLGRHAGAEIMVPEEKHSVALRHLLILVRATSHTDIRVRVLDLHTGSSFGDEAGRTLEAIGSDGSFFLSLEGLKLAFLVTGGDLAPIHDDPEVAYGFIPERIFSEEREGVFLAPARGRGRRRRGETIVTSVRGPLEVNRPLCWDDEVPKGTLTIKGSGVFVCHEVGEAALRRGLVLGRYSRCDLATGSFSDRLSRVHMVLMRDVEDLVAVDAGSSNGTWIGGEEIEVARVEEGMPIDLCEPAQASVVWVGTGRS